METPYASHARENKQGNGGIRRLVAAPRLPVSLAVTVALPYMRFTHRYVMYGLQASSTTPRPRPYPRCFPPIVSENPIPDIEDTHLIDTSLSDKMAS